MPARHRYRIDLTRHRRTPTRTALRRLDHNDCEALAALMLDAYRGTIDDEGETSEDARSEVDGWRRDGAAFDHSFVAIADGAMRSASLVTLSPSGYVLAYVITAADAKRTGLGIACARATLDSLRSAGADDVDLWITEGNVASEQLFARLGATRVSS